MNQSKPKSKTQRCRLSFSCGMASLTALLLFCHVGCDTGAYEKRILERQDELIYGDEETGDDSVSSVSYGKQVV